VSILTHKAKTVLGL